MSVVHLHLLLSHVPVIGILGVALLLVIGLWRRSDELARVALGIAVLVAVAAGAVFLTGEGAEEAVEQLAGISEATVEGHEDAAKLALWLTIGVGVASLAVLGAHWRRTISRGVIATVLVLSLAVAGVLAWTANLGGQIRHTEISESSSVLPARTDDRD